MFASSNKIHARLFVCLCVGAASSPSPATSIPANAEPVITCKAKTGCSDWKRNSRRTHGRSSRRQHISARRVARADANGNSAKIIGGRPLGCPHAYCGCGLRKFLGISDKRLNLAWNWARLFPRTSAHAGAAAVRHHHVMLLVRHVSGSEWVVRDYNSGKGLSRIHTRSIHGYVFVNPAAEVRLAKTRAR